MENKNLPPKNYQLKIGFISAIWQNFLRAADIIFNFFSLRKSRRFWGIVYDAVAKQPLDPVIVKLLYTDGREVETCVTDLGGRYGFLAAPGKFKIYARKTNYAFPSRYAAGGSDGIFSNLYHGEFFSLTADSEVVAPNIPMDPIKFDWNQQAKTQFIKSSPYIKLFFKRLVKVLFWFGLAFCLLFIWRYYPQTPVVLYLILVFYILIVLPSAVLSEPRLWGQIKIFDPELNSEKLFLELHNATFPGISFGKATVHENGKFLLRASSGSYVLSLSRNQNDGSKVFLCSLPLSLSSFGVLNATLKLEVKNVV